MQMSVKPESEHEEENKNTSLIPQEAQMSYSAPQKQLSSENKYKICK